MKNILMSIRAEISRTIFQDRIKRIEYRKRFNADYKGRIYVYESGKDGGKVAGFFDVDWVIKANREIELTDKELLNLDKLDDHNFNEFFSLREYANGVIYAIGIKNPCVFMEPMNLQDFAKSKGCTIVCAPQSWQYIECSNDSDPESVPVEKPRRRRK